jgi:type II secretion system protein C
MRALAVPTILLALALSSGCGAAPPPAPVVAEAPPPPAEPVVVEVGVIHRAALDEVLDRGLGAFLSRVDTEASLDDGRFVGFRLVHLTDAALFDGVDLQEGDVLIAVNGQSIERPEQAFTAWTGLRVASEITLEVIRGGARYDLRFPIVD